MQLFFSVCLKLNGSKTNRRPPILLLSFASASHTFAANQAFANQANKLTNAFVCQLQPSLLTVRLLFCQTLMVLLELNLNRATLNCCNPSTSSEKAGFSLSFRWFVFVARLAVCLPVCLPDCRPQANTRVFFFFFWSDKHLALAACLYIAVTQRIIHNLGRACSVGVRGYDR